MIVWCDHCSARVNAPTRIVDDNVLPREAVTFRVELLKCPVCGSQMLGGGFIEPGIGYAPVRLWPVEDDYIDPCIPEEVAATLREADTCMRHGLLDAARGMYGRWLEAVCKERLEIPGDEILNLADGLVRIRDAGIIDARMYEWGDTIRRERNLGVHATNNPPLADDIRDIKNFAYALNDYIYVLAHRYAQFRERRDAARPRAGE